jgi:hypothetical protein
MRRPSKACGLVTSWTRCGRCRAGRCRRPGGRRRGRPRSCRSAKSVPRFVSILLSRAKSDPSTTSARNVENSAICQSPSPQATPIAPASHMPAPVVRPCTSPRVKMTTPAARNATPAVTASTMRIGSKRPVSFSNIGACTISMVRIANVAAATQTSMCVRSPAGRLRHSRSKPIAAPKIVAISSRAATT